MTSSESNDPANHPFFGATGKRQPTLPFPDCHCQGTGTELAAPFLYSLVRMLRPERVLEIGSGYTTAWLAKAIEDNDIHNVHIDRNVDHRYFQKPHEPRLICIDHRDDLVAPQEPCDPVLESPFIDWINAKFEGQAKSIAEQYGAIDFAWFDCGGPDQYTRFCDEYLPLCNGFVFFHFTYTGGRPNINRQIISEAISTPRFLDDEGLSYWSLIDLVEPHKHQQGSITMLQHRRFRQLG